MRNYVLGSATTVLDLKKMIWEKTHVQPQRQKLLNLKLKGKPAPEEALLSNLDLKAGVSNKIMMMGSSEQGKKSLKIIYSTRKGSPRCVAAMGKPLRNSYLHPFKVLGPLFL